MPVLRSWIAAGAAIALSTLPLWGGLVPTPAAAAPDFDAMQIQPYAPPKPAPTFALPDLGGQSHRLEELRGKVVLLFFWATW